MERHGATPRFDLTTPSRCRGVRGWLLLGALLGCTPGAEQTRAPAVRSQEQVDRLVNLIGRRMEFMESVARWKWQQGRAIEDPDREAALLQSLSAKAKERGLDPEFVQAFFEAQIAAAKGVQQFWFEKWNRDEPPTKKASTTGWGEGKAALACGLGMARIG